MLFTFYFAAFKMSGPTFSYSKWYTDKFIQYQLLSVLIFITFFSIYYKFFKNAFVFVILFTQVQVIFINIFGQYFIAKKTVKLISLKQATAYRFKSQINVMGYLMSMPNFQPPIGTTMLPHHFHWQICEYFFHLNQLAA